MEYRDFVKKAKAKHPELSDDQIDYYWFTYQKSDRVNINDIIERNWYLERYNRDLEKGLEEGQLKIIELEDKLEDMRNELRKSQLWT